MKAISSTTCCRRTIFLSGVDKTDQTYIDWTTNETISIREYLEYAISKNWIDVTQLPWMENIPIPRRSISSWFPSIFRRAGQPDFLKEIDSVHDRAEPDY